MKTKNLMLTLAVLGLLFVASCKKKSEESPIYTQAQLVGTWEEIQADEDGCKDQLIFTTSVLTLKTDCGTGGSPSPELDYKFDGRKITFNKIGLSIDNQRITFAHEMVIRTLTNTNLSTTEYDIYKGITSDSENKEYVKK